MIQKREREMSVQCNKMDVGMFEYSFRSQMTSLTDTNGQVFTYAFDGDGNRIGQSLNDCLHARYIYDGPNVVLELSASNEVIHAVVNGPGIDQPVERIAYVNGEQRLRQVYHTDGLGSVALMTDESKTPIKTYAYDAFGRIRFETGELVMNRWTYTGREALGDSEGLYYYRWRVMDPNTGRFTSEDPLGFVDGPGLYGYVLNNPLRFSDFWGLYVQGKPIPVPPHYDTIVCKGGNLEIQLGETPKGDSDEKCTREHEQQHIEDWKKRYGPNLCHGIADGYCPYGGSGFEDFRKQTECDAYARGKKCREQQLKCETDPAAREKAKRGIIRDDEKMEGCPK